MVTRLIQKQLFMGVEEYEIIDDTVKVNIKTPFKQESLTVMLTVLDPEPVINASTLEFNSRVNGEPLLTLRLAKPNAKEFNDFVNTLKQRAQAEYDAFAGLKSAGVATELPGNVNEEPPEFSSGEAETALAPKQVDPAQIGISIDLLKQSLDHAEIAPLLDAMEALKSDPENMECLRDVIQKFHGLSSTQGAVLTYAPYINYLLSDDPFSKL